MPGRDGYGNIFLKNYLQGDDPMDKKYQIDTAETKSFLNRMCAGLLSCGHRFPSPGGGSYYLGDDGTPWTERNRETWITSRMAHVYSIGSFLDHKGSK